MTMSMKCTARSVVGWGVVIGTALSVALVATGMAQTRPTTPAPQEPVFRVQVWGYIVAEFSRRMQVYVDLRRGLEEGLPPLRVTDDPAEITSAQRALARRIRTARRGARQGDIFSPAISVEFKAALAVEMNAATWTAIMDDNPGEFSKEINGTYPDEKPFSTVPGTILAALPVLPDDVQYRFLGRHLILLDVRANVILDRIPYAIRCVDCDNGLSVHKEKGPRD